MDLATQFEQNLIAARQSDEPQLIVDLIPYSGFIGAKAKIDDGDITYWLDRRPPNIGTPSLPAIHGGVIGGFLELCASIELMFYSEVTQVPKVIDFSLDYLRPGRYKTIYASCDVLRQGKKLVNVSASAWQDDSNLPIATARCHFLLQ